MRKVLMVMFLCCGMANAGYAADDGKGRWIFAEKPLFLSQMHDSCTSLNALFSNASCHPSDEGVVITTHAHIDNPASVDNETAALRYKITDIQINAMHAGQGVRMIDKSQEPYMTGLYGFNTSPDNYNGRIVQKSYEPLNTHCDNFKIKPWYCTLDEPDTTWLTR